MRKQIDERIVERRRRTGQNVTISDWIREAAEEKLARETKPAGAKRAGGVR